MLLLTSAVATTTSLNPPSSYVNTLGGTRSRRDISTGNILPLAVRPWGFNAWAAQTEIDDSGGATDRWWFHPDDRAFYGVRCTHQPSPWIGDWGYFTVFPSLTDPTHSDAEQFSTYNPFAPTSIWKPHHFSTELIGYCSGVGTGASTKQVCLSIEVTPTHHGAAMRIHFPPLVAGATSNGFNQTRRVLVRLNDVDTATLATAAYRTAKQSTVATHRDGPTRVRGGTAAPVPPPASGAVIEGSTQTNHGGVPSVIVNKTTTQLFNLFFSMQVDRSVASSSSSASSTAPRVPLTVLDAGIIKDGHGHVSAYVDFDPAVLAAGGGPSDVTVRVATSLISVAHARNHLANEIGAKSFDVLLVEAQTDWDETIGAFDVTSLGPNFEATNSATGEANPNVLSATDTLTTVYSALYRAAQFPRLLSEIDLDNKTEVHYSAYDPKGGVHPGPLVADSGFWDAYRTVYPLLSLLWPQKFGEIIAGELANAMADCCGRARRVCAQRDRHARPCKQSPSSAPPPLPLPHYNIYTPTSSFPVLSRQPHCRLDQRVHRRRLAPEMGLPRVPGRYDGKHG